MGNYRIVEGAGWVVIKDGTQWVYDENGKRLECVIMTRVTDRADEVPTAIVQMVVNLASSEEEMFEKIKQLKNETIR